MSLVAGVFGGTVTTRYTISIMFTHSSLVTLVLVLAASVVYGFWSVEGCWNRSDGAGSMMVSLA